MAHMITDLPGQITDAGENFDWSVWQADTVVTLYNVPWDNSYKDIVDFGDAGAKYKSIDDYLATQTFKYEVRNVSYQDINKPVRLDIGVGYAQYFNYVRVETPAQPGIANDLPRKFYYFITDYRRIAPSTTEFILQLDVWNTFRGNFGLNNCYLERGHILMADSERFADNGRRYLQVPEGINVGEDYVTRYTGVVEMSSKYDIIVSSTIDWAKDFGTIQKPTLNMSTGTYSQNMFNGIAVYAMTSDTWRAVASYLARYPWIEQGIVSIQAVPNGIIDYSKLKKITISGLAIAGGSAYILDGSSAGHGINARVVIPMLKNWRDGIRKIIKKISSAYDLSVYDKLFTSPYTSIELTTFNGSPLILKPESWNDPDATVIQYAQVTPPNPKIIWSPARYNSQYSESYDDKDQRSWGDWLNQQTGIYNWPTFMAANDGARLAYANQARTIAWEYQSADWSQQKALRGNDVAAGQATNAIANMSAQNNVAVNARNQQLEVSNWNRSRQTELGNARAMGGATLGGVGALASGGLAGAGSAVMGLANAGMSMMVNNAATAANNNSAIASNAIANSAATASTGISQQGATYVRDTNKQYADYSANGDYANTVAGINARVQQLHMVPPSVVGQQGGEAFNLALFGWSLVLRIKTITDGNITILSDYFARYGYAVNRYFYYLDQHLNVMSKFTYWKVTELYVTPKHYLPHNYLNSIRGIFEKGVTVWNDPSDIGNCDVHDNKPLKEGRYIV